MADSPRVSSPKIQSRHEFTRGICVQFDGSDWVRASSGDAGVGLVGAIVDANVFEFCDAGFIDGLDGLTPGALYYVGTDGELTDTVTGSPIFKAYTTTSGHVLPFAISSTSDGTTGDFVTPVQLTAALAAEVVRATAADAAVASAAQDYADTQDIVTLANANAYTDAAIAAADEIFAAENKEGSTVLQGQVVAVHSSGTGFVLADAVGTSKPGVGLLVDDTINAVSGDVKTDGLFELADWTAVTGTVSLSRGPYYLDPANPGMLTATAPTTPGQIVQTVGYAVSPTILDISIAPTIRL